MATSIKRAAQFCTYWSSCIWFTGDRYNSALSTSSLLVKHACMTCSAAARSIPSDPRVVAEVEHCWLAYNSHMRLHQSPTRNACSSISFSCWTHTHRLFTHTRTHARTHARTHVWMSVRAHARVYIHIIVYQGLYLHTISRKEARRPLFWNLFKHLQLTLLGRCILINVSLRR